MRRLGQAYLRIGAAMLAFTPAIASGAETVTFNKDVAPILFENCVVCHRPGEVAPMSLRTFEEARPWAKSIKEMVHKRAMPPWFADPAHGDWANDARLSDHEIETIVAWADQGAKEGDPSDLPPIPEFTDGWQLGTPDHIITLPEVDIPATGDDYFPDLEVKMDVPERRWVRAVEVRPGNREVNHHVVLFSNRGGGMGGGRGLFDVLAVWAVGSPPLTYPEGMGRWVEPGDNLTTNMHYHTNGTPQKDQTQIGLYYGEGELEKEISAALAGTFTFEIPAGAKNHQVKSSYIIDQDVKAVSFFPHMHLRGQNMSLTAYYPDGRNEVLLNIPKWDFNWQLFYFPEESVFLPMGTRVDIVAHYDNSTNNPFNPDPNRNVRFGLQSTDEMMFGMFEFVPAEGVSPKPVSDATRIQALLDSLPDDAIYKVAVDMNGAKVDTALHLPREGAGAWYVPLMGQIMTLNLDDISWEGESFRYSVALSLGPISARLVAEGARDEAGNISGKFVTGENSALSRFLPFTTFQGAPPATQTAQATD